MRQLTEAQILRRSEILDHLTARLHDGAGVCTANEVREFMARHKQTYVTVDTIQRDLNAMQDAGSVRSIKHPNHKYSYGWLRTGSTCTLCGAATLLSEACGNCLPKGLLA